MHRSASLRLLAGTLVVFVLGSCGGDDDATPKTTTAASAGSEQFCDRLRPLVTGLPAVNRASTNTPEGLEAGKDTLAGFIQGVEAAADVAPAEVKSVMAGYSDALAAIDPKVESAATGEDLQAALADITAFFGRPETEADSKRLAAYFSTNCT